MSDFNLVGGVGIMGFISPMDTNDTYAVIDPLYGVDGLRNIDLISDLNLISEERRRSGMIVGVGNGNQYFKLKQSPWEFTINDWEEIFFYTSPQSAFTSNEIVGGYYDSNVSSLTLTKSSANPITITGFTSSSGSSSIYNSILDPNLTMASQVGGLSAGTPVSSLLGKSLVSIIDEILFPTQLPTYTNPTITISNSSTTLEIGSTYTSSLFAVGTKNDAGDFTYLDIVRNSSTILTSTTIPLTATTSNISNQFGYSNPNNPNYTYSLTYNESFVVPSGVTSSTTTYKSRANYLSGLAKYNNKGSLDVRSPQIRSANAPQSSGNLFESSLKTITGIYPYYYGFSDTEPTIQSVINSIVGKTANKVLTSASGNLVIPYNTTTKFIWFAHLASYGLKSQWYITDLNKGLMSPSSLLDVGVLGSVSSELGYWNNVNFYIYLGKYATTINSITVGNGIF